MEFQGGHRNYETKFPEFSLISRANMIKFPWSYWGKSKFWYKFPEINFQWMVKDCALIVEKNIWADIFIFYKLIFVEIINLMRMQMNMTILMYFLAVIHFRKFLFPDFSLFRAKFPEFSLIFPENKISLRNPWFPWIPGSVATLYKYFPILFVSNLSNSPFRPSPFCPTQNFPFLSVAILSANPN